MSLLLKALQRSQAEQNQREFSSAGASPARLGGYSGTAANPPLHGNTIINAGNSNNALVAVVIVCNMLLIAAVSYMWLLGQDDALDNGTENLLIQTLSQLLSQSSDSRLAAIQPVDQTLAQSLLEDAGRAQVASLLPSASVPQDVTMENNRKLTEKSVVVEKVIRIDSALEPASLAQSTEPTASNNLVKTTNSIIQDRLYLQDELSDEELTGFPVLDYNAHLYSPDLPSARMFMANNIRYTENDQIDQNTRVESIIQDGVIFNFSGLRIKVNVVDKLQ